MRLSKFFLWTCLLLMSALCIANGQTYVRVTADSVRIVNGELIIDNSSKEVHGALINVNNGVTRFQALRLVNIGDSAIALAGFDTLHWDQGVVPGKYYLLSANIPVAANQYYHPRAFEAALDSGAYYQVHALVYLNTSHDNDSASIFKLTFSDTTLLGQVGLYNSGVDTVNHPHAYLLEYNALIQSKLALDTLKLYFKTAIDDVSGMMAVDSLSYLYVEKVLPTLSSGDYTVDTPAVGPLGPEQYYVMDSARFNFTPVAQNVAGWTDVVGDPSKTVVTATSSAGITISTVATSLWNADSHNISAIMGGNTVLENDDPYPMIFDSSVSKSGFINTQSQFNGHDYNLRIGGLQQGHLYRLMLFGSVSQQYRVDSLGDPSVYGIRSLYRLANGRFASLTVNSNTSNTVVFDTVKSDANGHIDISIAGQDSTYNQGSFGTINALEVLDITKSDTGSAGSIISLYKNYYDTLLYVNDGVVSNRLVIVYKPRHYDPNKSYPILIGLAGQESGVNTDWDYQMVLQQNLGLTMENEKGDVYGIDKNGDTVRFVVLLPQAKINEWSVPPPQLHSILEQFKALNLYHVDNRLYLTGTSSGAQQAVDFAFSYPRITSAVFVADPAQFFSSSQIQRMRDSAGIFVENGGRFMLSDHGDTWGKLCDTVRRYLKLAGGQPYYRGYGVGHIGFAQEYKLNAIDEVYGGNMYDWLVYPRTKRFAEFIVSPPDARAGLWNGFNGAGSFPRPWNTVMTSTDTTTGWSANTVDITGWDNYVSLSGGAQTYAGNYQSTKFHINSYILGAGYRTKGSYATKGENLQITNLIPFGKYKLLVLQYLDSTVLPGYRTEVTLNGTDSISVDNYEPYNSTLFPEITGYADAAGTMRLGIYPDTKAPYNAQYGAIRAFMVVEDSVDQSHKAPLVNAGEDQGINLPVDSVTVNGTFRNINPGPGGAIASTAWSVLSQPAGANAVIHDPASLSTIVSGLGSVGIYKLRFSATDDSGYVGTDTVEITVGSPTLPLAVGTRILIDLGGSGAGASNTVSPQPDGRYWNTLNQPGENPIYTDFVDTAGSAVNMWLTTTGTYYFTTGVNTNGGNASGVGDYPSTATIDSWISYVPNEPESMVMLLPPGTYSFKFWGSRTTSGTLTTGVKLSSQSTYTTYNASGNADYNNAAIITGVVSDGATPITFNLDASTSSNQYGYYGVLDIHTTPSVVFNFNQTAQNVPGTVDVSGSPHLGEITVTDPATGWAISSVGTASLWTAYFGGSSLNNNGANVDDGGGFVLGDSVTRSAWYSSAIDTTVSTTPNLVISGLDQDKKYDLDILCSIDPTIGAATGTHTQVHINEDSGSFKEVSVDGNTSHLITYKGVSPDASGQINIRLNASSGFFAINGLRVSQQ